MVADAVVFAEGPWTHRTVSANGTRFHVAEQGEPGAPLVLLLHGFPTFWWSMRYQMEALAAEGYRAVAADLRGYGGSDKPPRGYDCFTLASDVAGLVRALGARDAILVGHDWGGVAAWCTATFRPAVVRGIVVIAAPHPLRMRAGMLTNLGGLSGAAGATGRGQLVASSHLVGFQRPWVPERQLVTDDAALVEQMLRDWSAPSHDGQGWPDADTVSRYRTHMQIPHVAHSALEYFRWIFRSQVRPDGWQFAHRLRRGIRVPTLQLHGALDTCVLPRTAAGSGRFVSGVYQARVIDHAGHFLHEETPKEVNAELLHWLAERDRSR